MTRDSIDRKTLKGKVFCQKYIEENNNTQKILLNHAKTIKGLDIDLNDLIDEPQQTTQRSNELVMDNIQRSKRSNRGREEPSTAYTICKSAIIS